MLKSLYSGVTGMKNIQTKMDVISNNIANVNTTAFKTGRVRFEDMLSQTNASAQAGINAQQVGLGFKLVLLILLCQVDHCNRPEEH